MAAVPFVDAEAHALPRGVRPGHTARSGAIIVAARDCDERPLDIAADLERSEADEVSRDEQERWF